MPETQVSSNENEDSFWNIIIVVIIVVIIWFIFFKKREGFFSNMLPKLSTVPNDSTQESTNKSLKIIQKINKTDAMFNDLKPMLNQTNDLNQNDYTNYQDLTNMPLSQYGMAPMNNNSFENVKEERKLNNQKDSMYPNLSSTKSFTDENMDLQNINSMPISQDTPDVRSLKAMNNFGFIDGEKVACNMLGVNSKDMDNYKKKFYSMYAHQIECPAKCGLKANGMSKGCGMGSKCGLGANCSNVNTDTSIPDTFALNYLALDNANKKSCVTCNFKPTSNPLNREWMEKQNPSYDGLPEDVKMADEARLKKMNLTGANVSNYVNWENNVYQDSIGESAPDRINEIRTCQDAYGTCSLKDYGSSIANAYDKLTANPSYTGRNNCNPYQLTGILEDAASTDMYANV